MALLSNSVQSVEILVIAMAIFWPSCDGQVVLLSTTDTGQNPPYNVYFADGQSTAEIGTRYLPQCVALAGTVPSYARLEKTDGSLRIAELGPLAGTYFVLHWNTTAHPTLNTSYSGTYVCRSNTQTSTEVYQINVVQRIVVTQQPFSLHVNDTGEKYSILASTSGDLPFAVNWTSSATLLTGEQNLTSFSFLSNDSGIQVGVSFTVNLTAHYQPGIPCAGNTLGSGYSLLQTVIDNCNAAAMPSQATSTVTVEPTCPPLPVSNFTIKSIARHPVNTNINVTVLCIEGYGEPTPPVIQCLAGGIWSAEPYCSRVSSVVPLTTEPPSTGSLSSFTSAATSPRAISSQTDSSDSSDLDTATTVVTTGIVKSTQVEDTYTLVVVIGAAAGGTAFGLVLMLLMVILIQKNRKTHQGPAPADTSAPTAQNCAYKDDHVGIMETAMTSSDAYGVLDVPSQPNYDYVLP